MSNFVKPSITSGYIDRGSYDEMIAEEGNISPHWHKVSENLNNMGVSELINTESQINRMMAENGVTYCVHGSAHDNQRNWTLNPIPWVIGEQEWEAVAKGVKQRAELLNLVHKDIYGERTLIKEGLLPYELVFGHQGFLRQSDQIKYTTDKFLQIYAADMARGPDRQIWVISDRTQAPSGMGYALENRLTIAKVLPDLFKGIHVKRLSGFFNTFKNMLKDASPRKKDDPFIVILTPGSYNETYFEHSYLASFLGYPLVQGNDLVTRDGFLWLKSLKGLTKVDVVLRRVDEYFCDPLELREDSYLGIAGLLDVVRRKNVTVINPIGSGVLENPGLIPFLPSISKHFLGEDLILPQIATWWCGQKKECRYVLENIDNLIIKCINHLPQGYTFIGSKLSNSEKDDLKRRITAQPYLFVGQEQVHFSTTPTLIGSEIEPRKSIWRTFAVADKDSYAVMPGGLIRAAQDKDSFFVSNQYGGTSKDLWITSEKEDTQVRVSSIADNHNVLLTGLDSLPSQTGENLYWVGRYTARALIVSRYIRTLLRVITDIHYRDDKDRQTGLNFLYKGLTHLTLTYPGFVGEGDELVTDPLAEIRSLVLDGDRIGSLSQTIQMLKNLNFSVKNLWSQDTWLVFDRLQQHWQELVDEAPEKPRQLIQILDELVSRLVAFMWLVEDSMFDEQGLILYFCGLRIEESILIAGKAQHSFSELVSPEEEYELMESILRNSESLNTYRISYRSALRLDKILELLLLDSKYPKSLANKLEKLMDHVAKLPHSGTVRGLTEYEKYIFEAYSLIKLSDTSSLTHVHSGSKERPILSETMSKIISFMMLASESISKTYFTHTYKIHNLKQVK